MGFFMLKSQGFVTEFGLDEAKLCMYLRRIEQGYDNSIPYHNWYIQSCSPAVMSINQLHFLSLGLNRGLSRQQLKINVYLALIC